MTEDAHPPHKRGLLAGLRANFLTGLIVILPIGLTVYLIWSAIGWIDSWVLPFIPAGYRPDVMLGEALRQGAPVPIRGLGVIVFLVFTIIVGWLAKGLIGRTVIRRAERVVDRMPVVRSLYTGLKQIAETVFAQSEKTFQHACLVEYPRKGMWGLGFVSTAAKGEIAIRAPSDDTVLSVFIPTTPNPTSGFLLYVPASDVILLDMSVEDAAKLIISAGLVYPTPKDAA